MSNIDTERQQVKNQITLQENALKFYMGMPIEAQIEIPKEEFEVVPAALTEVPNTENRTEYLLLKKQEELLVYNKKAVEAGYYPTLSLSAGYNYIGQAANALVCKTFRWCVLVRFLCNWVKSTCANLYRIWNSCQSKTS